MGIRSKSVYTASVSTGLVMSFKYVMTASEMVVCFDQHAEEGGVLLVFTVIALSCSVIMTFRT